MKNILVTGPPGCGKSTLVESVVHQLNVPAAGFITREKRERGRRVGFSIETYAGRTGILADVRLKSAFRVGKYGVDIETIDTIAVPALKVDSPDVLLVIDEIGKMECLSPAFRKAVVAALGSANPVLCSIAQRGDPFMQGLKLRPDVTVITVTLANREHLVRFLERSLREILANQGA